MAGSAILDPSVLVDSLVTDVIDGLRDDLHPLFGVRAFRVFTVVRTWTGGMPGEGTFSDVETELEPQPLVLPWNDLDNEMQPCGLDEAGGVTIKEVSLTYTYDELLAGAASDNKEHLIKISEAHGQAQPDRYFVHKKPPFPDRIEDMGWIMWLEVA